MKLLQDELSKRYNYKKLNTQQSAIVRAIYEDTMPYFLDDKQSLYTVNGSLICNTFDRIVKGDYGAFIEFSSEQANKNLFIIAPGKEYRLEPRYNNVKYIWLTINDGSQIKIYYQKNTVSYADYLPKKYYVSVYEVYPKSVIKLLNKEE